MKRFPLSYIFVLCLLISAFAPRVFSASFDCGKAVSATETLICKNHETSALDEQLQRAYKAALTAADPSSKKGLITEQRHWIAYTRDLCEDTACLQQAYKGRIAVLARNEKYIIDASSCEPSGAGPCVNVVTYRDTSIRIGSFNQSLTAEKRAGKIIGCSRLINLPVGTANGNNSFGGICTLQDGTQRKAVEICNDDMFGHFEVQPAAPQGISDKSLIDFTNEHCFGG
jgi:uncharacterized protein